MKLHFAEDGLSKEGIPIYIIDYLMDREQIEVIGNNIVFKNFTGVLERDRTKYLGVSIELCKFYHASNLSSKITDSCP
ncbi:hypothetical protein GFV12_04880 [Desulfurobacterium thermolithotrophum]|uniref:hypothetical protein n=1 Tax=Desulfurobacterium thermolithotrophum TaxID=64160 RepID=UPI0013D776E9|nr:hypothetical protein [Desulfurobacterium thermolithotrophum]